MTISTSKMDPASTLYPNKDGAKKAASETDGSMSTLETEQEEDDYSDLSDSDYDSDSDAEFGDLEHELLCYDLQRQRQRRASHNDAFATLLQKSSDGGLATDNFRCNQKNAAQPPAVAEATKKQQQSRSKSMPNLGAADLFRRMEAANNNNSYFQDPNQILEVQQPPTAPRPDQVLKDKLSISSYLTPSTFESSTWESYFSRVTAKRVAAHSLTVHNAIRNADLDALKTLLECGAILDGCNPQGESSVHLACRLGNLEVLKFLVEEGQVNVRVRDDQGKTALHDACWTHSPNMELVQYVVDKAPELLFLADNRQYAPLHYVPLSDTCEAAATWISWIDTHQEWLRNKVHHSTWLKALHQLDDAQERLRVLAAKAAAYS